MRDLNAVTGADEGNMFSVIHLKKERAQTLSEDSLVFLIVKWLAVYK